MAPLVPGIEPAKVLAHLLGLGQMQLRAVGGQEPVAMPVDRRVVRLMELRQNRVGIEGAEGRGTRLGAGLGAGAGRGAVRLSGVQGREKLIHRQPDGFGAPLEQQQKEGGKIHFAIPGKVPCAVTVRADPVRINQQAAQALHHAAGDFLYEAGKAFINFNLY
jgi:hypothetical protein